MAAVSATLSLPRTAPQAPRHQRGVCRRVTTTTPRGVPAEGTRGRMTIVQASVSSSSSDEEQQHRRAPAAVAAAAAAMLAASVTTPAFRCETRRNAKLLETFSPLGREGKKNDKQQTPLYPFVSFRSLRDNCLRARGASWQSPQRPLSVASASSHEATKHNPSPPPAPAHFISHPPPNLFDALSATLPPAADCTCKTAPTRRPLRSSTPAAWCSRTPWRWWR